MKRRRLATWLEWTLTIITSVLFIGVLMLDSISLKAIPWLMLVLSVIGVNLYILARWGKGVLFVEE